MSCNTYGFTGPGARFRVTGSEEELEIQEEDEQDDVEGGDVEISVADREMAREVAVFIAARAFRFEDHECRAWALTDFGVWATLAGSEPELRIAE